MDHAWIIRESNLVMVYSSALSLFHVEPSKGIVILKHVSQKRRLYSFFTWGLPYPMEKYCKPKELPCPKRPLRGPARNYLFLVKGLRRVTFCKFIENVPSCPWLEFHLSLQTMQPKPENRPFPDLKHRSGPARTSDISCSLQKDLRGYLSKESRHDPRREP